MCTRGARPALPVASLRRRCGGASLCIRLPRLTRLAAPLEPPLKKTHRESAPWRERSALRCLPMLAPAVEEAATLLTDIAAIAGPPTKAAKRDGPVWRCPFCRNEKVCTSTISDWMELQQLVEGGKLERFAWDSKPRVHWCNGRGKLAESADGGKISCKEAYGELQRNAAQLAERLVNQSTAAVQPPAPMQLAPAMPQVERGMVDRGTNIDPPQWALVEAACVGYKVLDAGVLLERNNDHCWVNYNKFQAKLSVFDSVENGKIQMHVRPLAKRRIRAFLPLSHLLPLRLDARALLLR